MTASCKNVSCLRVADAGFGFICLVGKLIIRRCYAVITVGGGSATRRIRNAEVIICLAEGNATFSAIDEVMRRVISLLWLVVRCGLLRMTVHCLCASAAGKVSRTWLVIS